MSMPQTMATATAVRHHERDDAASRTTWIGATAVRLALFAILLVALTGAVVGTLSYSRARHALEREARSRLALVARTLAERLHRELEDRAADTTNWADLKIMRALLYHDVDKELAQFLAQTVGGHPIYATLAAADATGAVIAAAGVGDVSTVVVPAGPRLSVVPGRSPTLRFDAPIHHPDRPTAAIGTLVAVLDRARLLETLDASPAGAVASVIVRGRGDAAVLANAPAQEPLDALRGMAPVGTLAGVDGPELEVVVTEPLEVALASVTALRSTLLGVTVLVLVLGSALGVVLAWWMSAPIRRLTGTVRDITARRRVDEAVDLPRARGEVGELSAAFGTMLDSLGAAQAEALAQSRRAFLGDVAANIAHEVRTPLSVLKTSAQLLGRQELPAAEQRRLAENVTAEVDRLNRVVTDLVDLARPAPVQYRDESLRAIVEHAVALVGPQATRLGVALELLLDDGPLPVRASADQLHQVLLNVMQNALQAMDGGGRLDVECRADGAWLVLALRDTGPGFRADVLARKFSPFHTTRRDGAGLGLAISRRIVEEHGGTMSAANEPGGGACVRIRLPRRGTTA